MKELYTHIGMPLGQNIEIAENILNYSHDLCQKQIDMHRTRYPRTSDSSEASELMSPVWATDYINDCELNDTDNEFIQDNWN
jgi:hypothetical protein